ncbi:MAG: hypothetical protein AB8F95_19460 [Bacteroidia bacterium]
MKSRWRFYLYVFVLFIPCLELALWIVGYRPYERSDYSIESEPAFCILPDSITGFALRPGSFTVTINEGHAYTVSHGLDSLRVCSFDKKLDSLPSVFVMGCSYTYGMGVHDSMTYSFLLQKSLPQYRFRNFGVPGFGTVQSLIQLEKEIAKGNVPEKVILGYAGFHMDRNALNPLYRRHLHMGFAMANERLPERMISSRIPFVEGDSEPFDIQYEPWNTLYENWPGRFTFASVNLAQNFADGLAARKIQLEDASWATIKRMRAVCEQHEISLLVAALTPDPLSNQHVDFMKSQGIDAINISVDLDDPSLNNMPYDSHPNERAHFYYAQQLFEYVSRP